MTLYCIGLVRETLRQLPQQSLQLKNSIVSCDSPDEYHSVCDRGRVAIDFMHSETKVNNERTLDSISVDMDCVSSFHAWICR